MRKSKSSLRVVLREAEKHKKLQMNWSAIPSFALLSAGFAMMLAKNFPSVGVSAWLMIAAELIAGCLLILLFGTKAEKWILPAGICILLAVSLGLYTNVTAGLASLGNDVMDLLTMKTGKIYLDFSNADQQMVPYALIPLLGLATILFARSAWKGQIMISIPILLIVYSAVIWGLIPVGIEIGLLIIGMLLTYISRCGKSSHGQRVFSGIPVYLPVLILCVGICVGVSVISEDKLTDKNAETIKARFHEMCYDSETNSMPEGDLRNLSAWKKSETPALSVTMETPGKVYLRGSIYEVYDGTSWEQLPASQRAEQEELFYWLHASGFYGQSQIGNASKFTKNISPQTMTVKNLSACREHGYYPYALYESEDLDADLIGDAKNPQSERFTYLTGSVPEWYAAQQTLASAQKRGNITEYLKQEQAYAKYVKTADLQLTQDSWAVMERQLKVDQSARSLADIRILIRDYLENSMIYDETIRTLNGNGDFLQYTLEQSGSGYNVHYATAATLMLRYFGVPARYVEGYFLSAEEAERYASGEEIVLTEEHAHAWAEYYLSGVGFIPFEVTPGYIDDEEMEMGGSQMFGEDNYTGSSLGFAQVQPPENIEEPEQDRATLSLKPEYLIWLLFLLILIFVGIIFARRLRLRKCLQQIECAECREGIAMRYGYAAYLLRHAKVDPPKGWQDAEKLNAEALFSNHDMTEEQRRQMDEYAEAVLNTCKAKWTLPEKLRYRLWDCIY
ncbi:MAG: transglutaminase domain-containing protein [Christensenellaceae bacterium]|nr:transglutaminase domain-containing protein [Christensenellaceae bacterium]